MMVKDETTFARERDFMRLLSARRERRARPARRARSRARAARRLRRCPRTAPGSGTARPSAERRSLRVGLEVAVAHELEGAQDRDEVGALERLRASRRTAPTRGVVEPVLPARVELLLDGLGQAPQRHAAGGIEHLRAPVGGDGEHRARLREAVRAREPAPERGGAEPPELALRVPPLGEVHLAEAGDDQAELQKAVEIDLGLVMMAPNP